MGRVIAVVLHDESVAVVAGDDGFKRVTDGRSLVNLALRLVNPLKLYTV